MILLSTLVRLHTDQGPDFESKLIQELCSVTGMKKTHTTPYHPRGNPVEQFNRTLLNMLGTLEAKQKIRWREFVKPLVHAYNCTRNEVTGYTPYELLFGRTPRLPVDLAFGLPVKEKSSISHSQYVKDLRARLEEAYNLASKNALKSAQRNKSRFDRKVTPSTLNIGDRVLVRNVRLRGKHKLADRWEPEVYVISRCAGDLPVYIVKPESCEGPTRTLHRDLLLPCGYLPALPTRRSSPPASARRPQTRSQSEEVPCHILPWSLKSPEESSLSFPAERVGFSTALSPVQSGIEDDPESNIQVNDTSNSSPLVDQFLSEANDTSVFPAGTDRSEGPASSEVVSKTLDQMQPNESHLPAEVPDPGPPIASASPNTEATPEVSSVVPRRSVRSRRPPSRLKYSTLGNPLISVVQTFYHSLSDVYTRAQKTFKADKYLHQ